LGETQVEGVQALYLRPKSRLFSAVVNDVIRFRATTLAIELCCDDRSDFGARQAASCCTGLRKDEERANVPPESTLTSCSACPVGLLPKLNVEGSSPFARSTQAVEQRGERSPG
jgi:hypothetical protein